MTTWWWLSYEHLFLQWFLAANVVHIIIYRSQARERVVSFPDNLGTRLEREVKKTLVLKFKSSLHCPFRDSTPFHTKDKDTLETWFWIKYSPHFINPTIGDSITILTTAFQLPPSPSSSSSSGPLLLLHLHLLCVFLSWPSCGEATLDLFFLFPRVRCAWSSMKGHCYAFFNFFPIFLFCFQRYVSDSWKEAACTRIIPPPPSLSGRRPRNKASSSYNGRL